MKAVRNFERTLWPRLPGSAAPWRTRLLAPLRLAKCVGAEALPLDEAAPSVRKVPHSPAFLGSPENYVKDLTEKLGGVGVDVACAICRNH